MKSVLVDMQHATKHKEEEEEEEGSQPNYLELRLGVSSSDHDCTSTDVVATSSASASASRELLLARGPKLVFRSTDFDHGFNSSTPPPAAAGTKRAWLPEAATAAAACCGGFVHPWSLAARQQKAAFEQAHHHTSNPASSSAAPRFAAPPAAVGWPPVRAFRRNIVGSQTLTKPEMNGEKEAKKSKVTREEDDMVVPESRPALFVKVNMEGFVVGRKINLKAYHSYDSLSRALQKMFNNFLSANYCNNSTEEEQDDHNPRTDYILLYEDHEGDRMLVGDVPWDMFITTVKRLHIAHNPKARKSEKKKERDSDTIEQ